MVVLKTKLLKKKKIHISKKTKFSHFDKVFKQSIEYWERLAADVDVLMLEILGAMNLTQTIDSEEFDNEHFANFIRVINRLFKETQSKTELLHASLLKFSIIRPIGELESKVIAALRVLGNDKIAYKSLIPLFRLAEKEGFLFPDWLRDCANLPPQSTKTEIYYHSDEARFWRWHGWASTAYNILDEVINLKEISSHESIKKQLCKARKNCRDIHCSIGYYHGDDFSSVQYVT